MTDTGFNHASSSGSRAGPGESVQTGTRWISFSYAVVQLMRLMTQILLARLLSPAAFGLMAMAMVVMMLLEMLRDLGTRATIVQKEEIDQRFTSSMFFVNLGVGIVMTAGLAAAAPLLAELFGAARLTPLLRVLALSSLATSTALVQQGLLQRHMRFRSLASVRIANAVAHGGIAIGLALAGFGVWSLVWGVIAGAVAAAVTAWVLSPWRPTWQFSWTEPREVAAFGLNLTGAVLTRFLTHTAERLIIGRALGSTVLGYWALVDRMFRYPWETVGQTMLQVMFPRLSRSEDRRSVASGYLRSVAVLALLTLPVMVGFSIVAEPFTRAVLGQQWLPAVPVMMILAPASALETLMASTALIYQVRGRTGRHFAFSLISAAGIIAGLLAGLSWGFQGVAMAYAVVRLALFYPAFALALPMADIAFVELLRTLAPYVVATSVMSGAVVGLRVALASAGAGSWSVLIACGLSGAVIYLAALALLRASALGDLVGVLSPRWRHRLKFLAPA